MTNDNSTFNHNSHSCQIWQSTFEHILIKMEIEKCNKIYTEIFTLHSMDGILTSYACMYYKIYLLAAEIVPYSFLCTFCFFIIVKICSVGESHLISYLFLPCPFPQHYNQLLEMFIHPKVNCKSTRAKFTSREERS